MGHKLITMKKIENCLDFERGLRHEKEKSCHPVWRLLRRA